jgi:hypothetical protein
MSYPLVNQGFHWMCTLLYVWLTLHQFLKPPICKSREFVTTELRILQDRQFKFNVILKRVRVTIFALESSKYYIFRVCVCSLSRPACKAHAKYYIVICGLSSYNNFSTLSHERHDFREILVVIDPKMCVLIFSISLPENVPILRRTERDIIINIYWSSSKLSFILVRFYYRVIKKSLCTWWLQYKNTQKYFKQFQSLTMITLLELGITDSVSVSLVSINVWRLAGDTLNITCNFLYCNHQVHRDFLFTLYNLFLLNRISKNPPYSRFHENTSSENLVVPYGQTDMTKVIVAFHNLAHPPKKQRWLSDFEILNIKWQTIPATKLF